MRRWRDTIWFKSGIGAEPGEIERRGSFCATTMATPDDVFVVHDATKDPRFADNRFVLGKERVRFYAGATVKTPDGHSIGTLCVLGTEPRVLYANLDKEVR